MHRKIQLQDTVSLGSPIQVNRPYWEIMEKKVNFKFP